MGSPTSIVSIIGSGSPATYAATVLAEAAALVAQGVVADTTHLWPVQSPGPPTRITIAGAPTIEAKYHQAMEQGRFLETSLGDAMAWVQTKKVDLDEKIMQYLDLNRVTLDSTLSDTPRALKMVVDSIAFVQKIQKFIDEQLALAAALAANVQIMSVAATRMIAMIQANINALSNLLSDICNWGLPALPSLPSVLGGKFAFPGFNQNPLMGFKFLTNNPFNFDATFNLCIPRFGDPASAYANTNPNSITADGLTYQTAPVAAAAGGEYGDPTQYTDPDYIAQMQSTTTPVFDPTTFSASSAISLPAAASIISNYSLPAASYTANICSACAPLAPIVIQPTDPDFTTASPSSSRQTSLRNLLTRYITLSNIVESDYDPNLMAAWLLYLQANRAGRSGTWIASFETAYAELIQPSLNYLATTPVPWNDVLGGTGVTDAPTAIPLIAILKADTANHLLWELSYIEAALLGYPRSVLWDAGADQTYVAGPTGTDLDYAANLASLTPTTPITYGVGTATYPVAATYPTAIGTVLQQVIQIATANIADTPSYQSTRPQFRFIYDAFAEATLIDRFSQFWRVFNFNLADLLTLDPYLINFTVTYPAILNAAINPLADPTPFSLLQNDAASRNRTWIPGSDLLPIPKALSLSGIATPPTDASSGWANGVLNASTYLSRPDVQAQSLPVQMAMLRTNQSYAALATLKGQIASAVSDATTAAQNMISSIGLPGWQVEFSNAVTVPVGMALTVPYATTDFDQTNYVENPSTFVIQTTSAYILNGVLSWDTTGGLGVRTVVVLQNGTAISTVSSSDPGADLYTSAFSINLNLTQGDIITVTALHSLATPQSLLSGNLIGLIDTGGADIQAAVPPSGPSAPSSPSGSNFTGTASFLAGVPFPAYSAVSQATDGSIYPIDPTVSTIGVTPFVDGIAMSAASAAGAPILVAVSYGSIFNTPGTGWSVGGLLYVAAGGVLTQDFISVSTTCRWVICVGKAISPQSFIFEPHLPTNYVQNF